MRNSSVCFYVRKLLGINAKIRDCKYPISFISTYFDLDSLGAVYKHVFYWTVKDTVAFKYLVEFDKQLDKIQDQMYQNVLEMFNQDSVFNTASDLSARFHRGLTVDKSQWVGW